VIGHRAFGYSQPTPKVNSVSVPEATFNLPLHWTRPCRRASEGGETVEKRLRMRTLAKPCPPDYEAANSRRWRVFAAGTGALEQLADRFGYCPLSVPIAGAESFAARSPSTWSLRARNYTSEQHDGRWKFGFRFGGRLICVLQPLMWRAWWYALRWAAAESEILTVIEPRGVTQSVALAQPPLEKPTITS